METFNLSHNITHSLFQKSRTPGTVLTSKLKFSRAPRAPRPSARLLLKQAITYTANAVAEGLKQNLLGADINMEYLTLTARALIGTYFKTSVHQNKNNRYNGQHLSTPYCRGGVKNFN